MMMLSNSTAFDRVRRRGDWLWARRNWIPGAPKDPFVPPSPPPPPPPVPAEEEEPQPQPEPV